MTIECAKELLAGFKAIFGTTKSHQKEKASGATVHAACDRFRILLELSVPIDDPEVYIATWLTISEILGSVDEQCKDVARFYFPCVEIVHIALGNTVDPVKPVPAKAVSKTSVHSEIKKNIQSAKSNILGRLFPSTYQFMAEGTDLNWHTELYKAAIDLKEQNYDQESATDFLQSATRKYLGYLDDHDLAVIDDVYRNRGGKYEFRENNKSGQKVLVSSNAAVFVPPTEDTLLEEFNREISRRKKSMAQTYTFISSAFDLFIRLESAALTLIGAKTGSGKTTCNLNLVVALLRESNFTKKILIISNEESLSETYSKIACLFLGYNWKTEYKNLKNEILEIEIQAAVALIQKTVTVITSNDTYDTTNLEDVKSILEHAKYFEDKYAVVILDYLQTITNSKDPNLN